MMRIKGQSLALKLGLWVVLSGLLAGSAWRYWAVRDESGRVSMSDWQVTDLVEHLQRCGLEFRAVPTGENMPLNSGAYLTTTDNDRSRLRSLCAAPEFIDKWKGTVFCDRAVRTVDPEDSRTLLWGDCWERVGPFVLFGDAELRARIRRTLLDSGVSPT